MTAGKFFAAHKNRLPSPEIIDALARAHQRHVAELYMLYGQRDGIDEPEIFSAFPASGAAYKCFAVMTHPLMLAVVGVFVSMLLGVGGVGK